MDWVEKTSQFSLPNWSGAPQLPRNPVQNIRRIAVILKDWVVIFAAQFTAQWVGGLFNYLGIQYKMYAESQLF